MKLVKGCKVCHEQFLKNTSLSSKPSSTLLQGRSRRSGWSGFSQTTISQDKNKIPFYKKQVINKSTRVIFGLVQLIILWYNR